MTNKHLYITLLVLLGLTTEVRSEEQPRTAPRLVISITIDQLRSDYLEAFAPLYSEGGLKRLLNGGRVYVSAAYPFAPVDRASAIATLSTGTTPYYHSIVGDQWLNRETLRPVGCVDDSRFPGLLTHEMSSPNSMLTSTIGDELKIATGGKALVYAIAPFREAAVLSAGHSADMALWIDNVYGDWCAATYYNKLLPGWVSSFNTTKAPARKIATTLWEPLYDVTGTYNYFLNTEDNKPFKHKFTGDYRFVSYKESALVNADVTEMACHCMTSTGMGGDMVTDLLCLTYYAGTYGHQRVTDCQMELQDTYLRLDRELNRLMTYAERIIGEGEVLFVITSTGYSDVEPADYEAFRIPTGTLNMTRMSHLLNMYLGGIWGGQSAYVETTYRNHIFLNHKLLETRKISLSEATMRAQEIAVMMQGVRNVYTAPQLLTTQSPQMEKMRNAFHPQRSGDLIIEAAPGWNVLNEDTHQSHVSTTSATPFPIIIYGAGTQPERITETVTTDRIAPTIARSIRIRAPNACSSEPLF